MLITGGTGGHVLPAVNFGNYLISKNFNPTLITDERGVKYTSNFKGKVFIIKASHLSGNILFNIFGLIKLLLGFFQSFYLLMKIRPKIVISFGSYAALSPTFSLILIRKLLNKISFYIHEQNSFIGKSNRILISYANKFFVNFDKQYNINKKHLNKIYSVGLPYNSLKNKNLTSVKNIDFNTINFLVYGGSQGSLGVLKIFQQFLNRINSNTLKKIKFIVQCPDIYKKNIIIKLNELNCDFIIDNFFINFEELLAKTNIVLSRAGAGTINDLIRYKIPSVLVPLPNAKDNHQYENALILEKNNCAIIIKENKEGVEDLIDFFEKFIKDKERQLQFKDIFSKIKLYNTNKLMLNEILDEKKTK